MNFQAVLRRAQVRRVVAAYQRSVLADQPPGARQKAHLNALPINKPKGLDRDLVKENAIQKMEGEDVVRPQRRDILPKDVFAPTLNNMGVLNLVETDSDLTDASKKIKKDKGHDVVYNLSQYLIRTEGNGDAGTEEGSR